MFNTLAISKRFPASVSQVDFKDARYLVRFSNSKTKTMLTRTLFRNMLLLSASLLVSVALSGCDRKETIMDVDTPNGGGVELERDVDTGAVTVDVDDPN